MKLSAYGQKISDRSAIVDLMDDLGDALNVNPDLLFLGGGNPAVIPTATARFDKVFESMAQDGQGLQQLLGVYQSPKGNESFADTFSEFLNSRYGWPVSRDNLAVVNGSQSAFYVLLNAFAGRREDGTRQKILLPLVPEYLGYADQGIDTDIFLPRRPLIEIQGEHRFKYRIDFDALVGEDADSIGAICLSRPTNPSGNVVSDDDLQRLSGIAKELGVPLIVDCAYGHPFPGLVYTDAQPYWDENTIVVMSASKLGLPGVRTGIILANPEVIELVARANTIMSLASGGVGPYLLENLISTGELNALTQQDLPAYYAPQRTFFIEVLEAELAGLPYAMHNPEGAFFIWLWLRDLPVASEELYQQLKAQGVLIMAGEGFFFGLADGEWKHANECIRLTYCQPKPVLQEAAKILGQLLRGIYAKNTETETVV